MTTEALVPAAAEPAVVTGGGGDSPPFSKALAVARSVSTSRTVNRGCQPAALSNEK